NQTQHRVMKQNQQASQVLRRQIKEDVKKKAYRKPALKRLGMLKSVAGSGIHFGVAHKPV
ncbi:MAG: hypothetical protein ABSA47_18910, partial [Verrucomicrobiota bacterium]